MVLRMKQACAPMRFVFLVAALFLLPAVAGQSAPSVTENTFYGNVDCDGPTYGLSTIAASTSTNCGTGAPATSMEWSMPETRAADSILAFEPDGEVVMTVWIGSGTHAGNVDVTGTVYAGTTVVATGAGSVQFIGAVGGYEELVITTTVQVTEAIGPLRWEVVAEGGFSSIFLRFEEGRWSRFTLPILPADDSEPPTVPTEQVELDEAPNLNLTFENSTRSTIYTWLVENGNVSMDYSYEGTGTVQAIVTDGGDEELFNATLDGADSVPLSGEKGDWTLRLSMTDATGTLSLRIAPVPPATSGGGDPSGTTSNTSTGSTSTNGTSTETNTADAGDEGEDSPALPLVALLVAIVAMAAARRR